MGTHGRRAGRIDFTLPVGVGRLGVHGTRLSVAAGALTVALVASSAVALAAAGDAPAPRAKPAAAERDSAQTPVGDLLTGGGYPTPALSGDTGTAGVPAKTSPRPTAPVTGAGAVADAGRVGAYAGRAGTLTPAGIATLAMAAGCSPGAATVATAVAMAESGGSPAAQGDTTLMDATWDWSAGLWQIRGLRAQRNTGALRDSIANHDPVTNAAAMYSISSGCRSWGPWTTFTRGTYRSFLDVAGRAVAAVEQYRDAHGGKLPPVAPRDPGATVPAAGGRGGGSGSGSTASKAPDRRSTTRSATPTKRPTSPAQPTAPTSTPTRGSGGGSGGSGGGSGGSGGTGGGSDDEPTSTPSQTPIKTTLPTTLPTKLPTLLPTKLPTKLPIKLPTKLPSLGVPGL